MPELADLLAACTSAQAELRRTEEKTEEARARLTEAVKQAHEAGLSKTLIARAIGLSRQRVSQLLERE